jgi:argininosuccinate lyase
VALAEQSKKRLDQLELVEMQAVESRITADIFNVLTVEASAASRRAYGGTAPANVKAEAKRWIAALDKE